MSKYDELKQYISSKILKYQNQLDIVREELTHIDCNENTDKWNELSNQLKDCIVNLWFEKDKENV